MKVIDDDDDDDDDFDDDDQRKKPTLAQTIDQVMTIKTHTESSKTELSSGGKRPFKVWRFFNYMDELQMKWNANEKVPRSKKSDELQMSGVYF